MVSDSCPDLKHEPEEHRNCISSLCRPPAEGVCDYQEPGVTVGENHVKLAIWLAHLMPETYLLGLGAWIISAFLEEREASLGERKRQSVGSFFRL